MAHPSRRGLALRGAVPRGLFSILSLSIGACTPSWEESIAKSRGNADTYRQVLAAVAGAIDAAPPPAESTHCKPPKPVAFSPMGAGHATELYVYEDLRAGGDPAKPEKRPDVDLSRETPMHWLLADTHPAAKLTPAALKEKRADRTEAYERATKVKNVIVLRARGHDRERGVLFLDYFVVAFDGAKIECAGSVTARADPNLGQRDYEVKGTDDAGVRRVLGSGHVDLYLDRMKLDATKKLEERFRDDFTMDLPKPEPTP
ncbi:MAG: hypothetical protein JST00_30655 [Deltaproteobacteria bacterium]|nr:hypothetical protein [Deltaproteobacteria bacterium]